MDGTVGAMDDGMSVENVMQNDVRVTSWNELLEQLYTESWQEDIGRYRSRDVFRGMNNVTYDLSTGLSRHGGRSLEASMLRAFRKYAYRPELSEYSIWNWLALAQHYGLSTRLLDWTYSPLVAMHFATEDIHRRDVDGVVWAVDHTQTNELLPDRLQELLDEADTDAFTVDMLDRAASSLEAFDALADEPFVAFFEPPSLDERIVNQYALFALVSDPRVRLDEWLAERPCTYRRIIIPAELKLEARDKLDNANITERVLYPGLDGLSRWLNRYYTPMTQDAER